jgi:pimeloyl-ACP methyl ester carboxylesterase
MRHSGARTFRVLNECRTPLLRVPYVVEGPVDGSPVLLLHGWPDDPHTFDAVAPALHRLGYRTFAPWLRGFGATRFLSEGTPRSGQIAALTQDALDVADALGLDRFGVVGHDWGARAAYFLSAVAPQRIVRCAAMSVGWEPGGLGTPAFEQAQAFWYQWFMTTERGAATLRARGREFARFQWETWSPPGWFDAATFDAVAASFDNPDWAEVTLHAYRVRWQEAEPDPQYADLERAYAAARSISVATLVIQGGDDRCVLAAGSAGKEANFSGDYARHVLAGVGHFPTREAPRAVGDLLAHFFTSN